ncbi:Malectin-like carbohydrate-binding protein [Trema orientale]|uniref:Malectin-like carbohydrate-binding protein n=1 Tax=Trema orientale TaxID=63057 RepID=A0A2P5BYP1_TREOI|nr:Malectin-like carbohydrate-binding protein [Trema orientale]
MFNVSYHIVWLRDVRLYVSRSIRYQDDIYDRIWEHSLPLSPEISTINSSRSANFSSGYSEQPAATVLNTAVQARGTDMKYNLEKITNPTSEFSVYLHFAELVQPPQGRRHFTVTINDIIQGPFNSPGYMGTMYVNGSVRGIVQISIEATNDSRLPPILNGLEVFVVVPLLKSPSNSEDVNAMMEIKRTYGISEDSWQGDPCVPANLSWSRVGCSSNDSPRIISLNLSSRGLTGDITASLSNLKSLRVL